MMDPVWIQERIDTYLEQPAIRGIQVGIVIGAEVITLAAGVRNAVGAPVTSQTVYPIGSTTKAFTAAAVGICVDRGLLHWDDRVRDFIPWFRMMDPYASDHLTLRDALCHRSGLPRHEFSWMGAPVDTVELIRRLAYLPPNYGFRTEYRYNNQMYAMLGYIVSQVTGISFPAFLSQHLIQPLDMQQTCFSVSDIPSLGDNFATPFAGTPQGVVDIPYFNIDNIGGAGCINSTADNMTHWMMMQLQQGQYHGEQIISASSLKETQTPQIVANNSRFFNTPDFDLRSYAMGWYVENYRGVTQLRHTGGIHGFFSHVALIPAKQIGVTVMVNTCGGDVTGPILFELLDHLAGYEPRDWNGYDKNQSAMMDQGMQAVSAQILSLKDPSTCPSRPITDFASCYHHDGYGDITFTVENESLVMHFNIYEMPLSHLNHDVFCFDYQGIAVPVQFITDCDGSVHQVHIQMEHEMDAPIMFVRC